MHKHALNFGKGAAKFHPNGTGNLILRTKRYPELLIWVLVNILYYSGVMRGDRFTKFRLDVLHHPVYSVLVRWIKWHDLHSDLKARLKDYSSVYFVRTISY